MRECIQTKGLVLDSQFHRERNRILTLFSPTLGKISVYMKNTKKSCIENAALATPLTEGEFLLRPTSTDFFSFIEGKALNIHLPLREEYGLLQAALSCVELIKKSQWRGSADPALYILILKLLQHLPKFKNPHLAYALCQIKLLKHEGLLSQISKCTLCKSTAPLTFIGAEPYCLEHQSCPEQAWEADELKLLDYLYQARTLKEVESLPLLDTTSKRINTLFEDLYFK